MAVSEYDMVRLTIGHNNFVVPRKLATLVFEAAQGEDFYLWDYVWQDGKTKPLVKDFPGDESFITVRSMSPAQFHMGRIAWQDKLRAEEEKAKSDAPT